MNLELIFLTITSVNLLLFGIYIKNKCNKSSVALLSTIVASSLFILALPLVIDVECRLFRFNLTASAYYAMQAIMLLKLFIDRSFKKVLFAALIISVFSALSMNSSKEFSDYSCSINEIHTIKINNTVENTHEG